MFQSNCCKLVVKQICLLQFNYTTRRTKGQFQRYLRSIKKLLNVRYGPFGNVEIAMQQSNVPIYLVIDGETEVIIAQGFEHCRSNWKKN